MHTSTFTIDYNGEKATVAPQTDKGNEQYYVVQLPGEKVEVFLTPEVDGMPSTWAEGPGNKTERARELGLLIEQQMA